MNSWPTLSLRVLAKGHHDCKVDRFDARTPLVFLVIALALASVARALDSPKSISQFAQTSWSAKDGSPGPVRAIVQPPDGYLRLGSEPTATRAGDGRLWFATTGGVAVIDPREWPTNVVPPSVAIETVKADDHVLASSSGFDFAAPRLTVPERVRFRYKLEGYDHDWRGPINARQVSYTNLPPRSYRSRVTACNNDGVWNEDGAALELSILPAFYQANWFLLLCAAAAGCLTWAGYQWRVHQMAARLDLQFRVRLSERKRVAQDLHDTLLQGFLSASMQLQVAETRLPDDSPAKPIVGDVLVLIGSVIEDGRKAVRGLRSWQEDTCDLTQSFSRIPQELAIQQPIDYRVIVEGQPRPMHPAVRDEVYRIAREALVNAFRHSRASGIEVELKYGSDLLQIIVRDDGCGIDPQVLHAGREGHWGLPGMRERAERIGARLKVWSRSADGTEVELAVPSSVAFRRYSPGWFGWATRWHRRKAELSVQRQTEGREI